MRRALLVCVATLALASLGACRSTDKAAWLRHNPTADDWVDLGLPSGLLWATHNVGATAPEGCGAFSLPLASAGCGKRKSV